MAEAGLGGGLSAAAEASPAAPQRNAIRRLYRDLQTLQTSPNPMLEVRPLPSNMLEWHFVLHDLPAETPYSGACYHGKLVFPPSYPMAPPSIYMLTPNGRLDVNKKLCLSMTDYHPESWNPAWSTETILVGFLSFFTSDKEHGYGSISKSHQQREHLAQASWDFNAADAAFAEIFPDFVVPPAAASSPSDGTLAAVAAVPPASSESALPVPLAVPRAAVDFAIAVPAEVAAAAEPTAVEADGGADVAPGMGIEGVATPLATAVTGGGSEDDGETPECWICRDDTSTEPLIQPCACRGSMSYVHASCVEAWVAHHRQTAMNGEAPRCSVCHQVYHGQEERPGFGTFVRQACIPLLCSFALAILRFVVVLCVVFAYVVATRSESDLPWWARVLLIVMVSLAVLHKVLVLTVTLPVGQQAPANRFAKIFFEPDQEKLSLHLMEWTMVLFVSTALCLSGILRWQYLLPLLICGLGPFFKVWRMCCPSLGCLKKFGMALLVLVVSPFLLLCVIVYAIYKYPKLAVHPLGVGWHIAIDIASWSLMLSCQSNVPVMILWCSHGAMMLCGLVELLFIRRLKWYSGFCWYFAWQCSVLTNLISGSSTFPMGWGARQEDHDLIVHWASLLRTLVFCVLLLSVNWETVALCYRTWQNRNGRFTLAAAPGTDGDEAGAGGSRVAVADDVA